MNKDFEAEYRAYQNQSAPDLWSRIEAGIDAEEEKKSQPKKVIKFPVWKTATIVAACFAVIICIPALGIMMSGFGGSKYTENATADVGLMTECETAYEEMAESESDSVADCVTEEAKTESTNETTMDWGYDEFNGVEEEASTEAEAGVSYEETILDVNVMLVECLENEIRYTVTNIDTEEEIMIIQISDTPSMKEGCDYTLLVTKTEEDVYYFEALVVE